MRGVTCDVLEGEEASFIPQKTYEDVLDPLFLMEHVTGIFISTMMGHDNYYSKMFEKKHPKTGKPMFTQVKMLLVCSRKQCLHNPIKCWHKIHHIPYWQSICKHAISRTLMDSETVAARELTGLVTDDGIKLFDEELVEAFITSRMMNLDSCGVVRFAITAVDPNNNGSSAYSITTVIYSSLANVVR